MEEKTHAPELSDSVEIKEETARGAAGAVIPSVSEGSPAASARQQGEGAQSAVVTRAKPEGAPAGSERQQGEGDPSARAGISPPLAQDDVPAAAAVAAASALAAPYDAVAVGFAARSARAADEAEALYAAWVSDAAALAKEYPGFDLAAAAKEPAFARLLRGGADLRSAYEATHMDSVRAAIRAAAAAEAEACVLDSVRLRGLRPDENGARPGSAVLTGGMAGLTRSERAEIARKAMRGLL